MLQIIFVLNSLKVQGFYEYFKAFSQLDEMLHLTLWNLYVEMMKYLQLSSFASVGNSTLFAQSLLLCLSPIVLANYNVHNAF